jgi:hypothetical protein
MSGQYDWVLTRIFLAHYGLQNYLNANPLNEAQNANWPGGFATDSISNYAHPMVVTELAGRALQGQYVYPIQATATMRMMTPPKPQFFADQDCLPPLSSP